MMPTDTHGLIAMGLMLALAPIITFLVVTDGTPPRKRRKARKSRK